MAFSAQFQGGCALTAPRPRPIRVGARANVAVRDPGCATATGPGLVRARTPIAVARPLADRIGRVGVGGSTLRRAAPAAGATAMTDAIGDASDIFIRHTCMRAWIPPTSVSRSIGADALVLISDADMSWSVARLPWPERSVVSVSVPPTPLVFRIGGIRVGHAGATAPLPSCVEGIGIRNRAAASPITGFVRKLAGV